jgi:hypothetical protein
MDRLFGIGRRHRTIGLRRARNAAPVRHTEGHQRAMAASGVTGRPRRCEPGKVTDREAVHG